MNSNYKIPYPSNEPVRMYAPGSAEKAALKSALNEAKSVMSDIPLYIGAEKIFTRNKKRISPPHQHALTLGYYHEADSDLVLNFS